MMPSVRTPTHLGRFYRFGDFEYSVRSCELRQNGELVRLQFQPLRLLLVLLENSGEVVTREEIRNRVWQGASIQDFDNSLRVAVNKLRQALGDDSDKPVYIETLPRRGYRWLHPATVEEGEQDAGEIDDESSATGPRAQALEGAATDYFHARPTRAGLLRRSIITLLLSSAALAGLWQLRPHAAAPDPRVVPLTTYSGLEYMPAISPDGKRLAFAWTGPNPTDPYRIYLKEIGQDRTQQLVTPPAGAADSDPVWTPDGQSVLFYRRGGPSSGIYVLPVTGGTPRQLVATSLTSRRVRRARFDLSPNGKQLVYVDELHGRETIALFLLDLDTMQSRQITNPPPNSEGDGDPAFSHDGKAVAFQRDTIDRGQIFLLPVAGGTQRLLTASFISDYIDGLAWSSDDREIIFGGTHLRRVSATGREPSIANIAYVPGPAAFPSLREHMLAYVQETANANVWRLQLRDATHPAGEPAKLISSTRQQAAAAFSPDGSRMAFQSDRSGDWEIWTCDRDGSNATQLTHFRGAPTGTPRWSPDGTLIAFDSRANGLSQIFVVPAAGGEPRQVTTDSMGAQVPAWSRDGKWIYYSVILNNAGNVWRLPVAGGIAQPVTSNSGLYAVESPDSKYLYYSRSSADSTIWRTPLSGGAEERLSGIPKPFDPSHWVIVTSGIYVIDGDGDLYFYRLSDSSITKVMHDARFITDWSMAISPDGYEIVWAQIDTRQSDLMLVENFR
jgi:Tol biopolymer transport system component/DNA-binding winged helix-turn-helix (wHTH) protein